MSSFSLVHRDRHSRPARAPVHAPAHLPCCVASPITHTPGRSESVRLSAPRGGCCRFVMRSAGPSRQQTCDDRLGCGGIPTAGTLLAAMFVCFGMPNAVWRQCDVRATAKASDGMLLSGVPIPGCRSPLPLGPTFTFQIGLGLANLNRRWREGHWQPTSVTALGGFQSAMAGSQQACPS